MKRLTFILIVIRILFAGTAGAQCVNITNPAPVCAPATVDITAPSITLGSTATSFSYFTDLAGTIPYTTPTTATNGTYYIQGTGGIGCPTIQPVTVTVNPNLPVSVSIAASANPVCAGTSVTFTATPTNGGSAPAYQWKVNGGNVGPNSNTYSYVPANGDVISCLLTSNAVCASGSPAISNSVTMTVNANLPVSISIAASANPVCAGTSVIFTATPTNGGSAPAYQWKVNGGNVGSNSNTYSYVPVNGNVITCVLTSNAICATGSPAISNSVTMTVNVNLPVGVSIAASANPVCAGTSVTFTATPTNGGSTPAYQWKVNGGNVGSNSNTYSYVPANGDVITCVLTSNAICATGSPAISNSVTMTVNANLPVSVSIAASANPVCAGTSVTFTATPTNGGSTPAYQWKVNGGNVGSNTNTYSYIPANGNVITCVLTSNAVCATGSPAISNSVTMTVNANLPVSVSIAASANPVCAGTSVTFTATPANGGTPVYQWKVNGLNVGTNSPTYTSSTLANNNVVTVVMSSSLTCVSGSPATSNPITMSVNPTLTAGISGGSSPICYNTAPGTFTATGGGGSGSYTYLWYKDLISTGVTTQTYSPGNMTATSSFYCAITSGVCGTVNTSTKTIIVNANLTATISGGVSPICYNSSPGIFNASGTGGTGSYTYLWYKDLISTGITTQTYSPGNLTATSSFYCAITSGSCGTVNTSTSTITVTAQPTAAIFYTGSPWCGSASVQNVTLAGTSGGTYSAVPAGLSIDATTGAITPGTSIAGTYTVIYTIAASGGCGVVTATTSVTISPTPSAPGVGSITQTTCSVITGSVVLNNLPSAGAWILTRNPGSVTTAGSGTTTTVSNLQPGTYTFTVTNIAGCVSPLSADVVISPQPASPATPVQSVDCSLGFGHAVITVISPTGADLEYSLDGGAYQVSSIFNTVNNGSHYISVRNASGCTTGGALFAVSCGCVTPPTVTLSSSSGSTCGTTAVTVTGNSFGGTATSVTITSNGAGSLIPTSAGISPFSFTYTPALSDGGKAVIITVTTNNPLGAPCAAAVGAYTLTVNALPTAPAIGTITNLTCTVATGSVVLNGLPSPGTWTLIRNPGSIISNGTGTSTTVSGLVAGTYNFIVTSALGCTSVSSADVVINPQPSSPTAPVIGLITQPTCALSTGSVSLSGLPSTGTWTLTRNPGGVTITGSGTTTTVSTLPSGTYTFTVTNSTGCVSSPSGNVLINAQPPIPAAPSVGTITPPSCTVPGGGVILSGLPSSGTWTLIRYPGTVSTTGTGTSTTIAGLAPGTYNYTVTTADGCLSVPSANVVIPVQPPTPAAPVVGTITQPTFAVPTGSVVLSGLPSNGTWVITRLPGALTTTGTGTSRTITNLNAGVYTFKVTNSSGCTSAESVPVTISSPGAPVLIITDPSAVCSPNTVNITNSLITTGSTPGLIYTYWTDANATIVYSTPTAATAGIYYIKGTTVSGYFNIKPVTVIIDPLPVPNAGVDQTLDYKFNTTLDATILNNETGIWSLISGTASFSDYTDPKAGVSDLSMGDNILLWTVRRGVCPAVFDTVKIIVNNLVIPTLITPNMDGRNDYFVLRGLETLGRTELVIFNRKGAQVYKNMNYDNSWNGIDYNKNPLPDDTYFYVLKAENGKTFSGYIVVRR